MFWGHARVLDPSLYNHPVWFQFSNNKHTDYYSVTMNLLGGGDPNFTLGWIILNEVPSCCGMLFVNNLNVYASGVGHGAKLLECVKRFAELGRYTAIQCVIAEDSSKLTNVKKKKCFTKAGFKLLRGSRFKNTRSGNYCATYQLIMENK